MSLFVKYVVYENLF